MFNIKALGLALVAAFAMSALTATAVQANAPASFWADGFPAVMKGSQEGEENFFESTPGRRIVCNTATYQATLEEESTELTVTPHYAGCSTSGVSATVTLNGCHFKFTAKTTISTSESTGTADVICAKDQSITITAGTCVVHVTGSGNNENQNLTGVTFTNVANGDVTVDVDITDQISSHETDGFLCPFEGNTTPKDGDFVSKVLVGGFQDLGTKDGPTAGTNDTYAEGAATDIEVK